MRNQPHPPPHPPHPHLVCLQPLPFGLLPLLVCLQPLPFSLLPLLLRVERLLLRLVAREREHASNINDPGTVGADRQPEEASDCDRNERTWSRWRSASSFCLCTSFFSTCSRRHARSRW